LPLPDFLVIGAPKAGTTALHVALSRHPQLYLSEVKEPKYFMTDDVPPPRSGGPGDAATFRAHVWQRSDYEALFDPAPPGTLRGESTTLYLRDREAHRRIHRQVPNAKLIAVLRDPVERAHSNWTHLRSAGLEPEADFLKACGREAERAADGWAAFWRYLDQGRYGEHLAHLYRYFPPEQVLVLLYRDYREHPQQTVDTVCEFLGVETGQVRDIPTENMTAAPTPSRLNDVLRTVIRRIDQLDHHLPRSVSTAITTPAVRLLQREQRGRHPLAPEERTALIPYFAEDIALLERLTGRSFDHWRDVRNGADRAALDVQGRFGSAYRSIDRPVGNLHPTR
jgi:hypothetical protein